MPGGESKKRYLVNVAVMAPCNAQIFVEADSAEEAERLVVEDDTLLGGASWEVSGYIGPSDITDIWAEHQEEENP